MERRLALTYSVSAVVTLAAGCFTIAAVWGGLFAGASPRASADGTRMEMVDDYIVVHSSTTVAPEVAAVLGDLQPTASGSTRSAGTAAPTGRAPAVGPLHTPTASPTGTPDVPAPDSPTTVSPIAALAPIQPPPPADTAAPDPTPPPAVAPGPVASPASAPAASTPPSTTAAPQPPPAPASPAVPSGVRIPSDWPADKPIPPIPAGCRQPQLEDNGVWNCQ